MKTRSTAAVRLLALSTLVLSALSAPALAGKASFSIPPTAVGPFGGANNGSNIGLPAAGTSGINIGFVLPPDYKADSTVTILLHMHGGSSCAALLAPVGIVRTRKGEPIDSSLGGFKVKGGGLIEFDNPSDVEVAGFVLKPGSGLDGQRRGDGFLLGIMRDGDDVDDTCGVMAIDAIEIRYTTPTKKK